MEFYVHETQQWVKAKHRPIIIITSNNEKDLPDPFLRRCFFHYIQFPNRDILQKIVDVHYPNLEQKLMQQALNLFMDLRDVPELRKRPSTSELLDWIRLLASDQKAYQQLTNRDQAQSLPPYHGALVKNEQDVSLLEQLSFMFRTR